MNSQSKKLQNEKLEALAGGLENIVKNRSLRGKVAKLAVMAASVAGISIGMGMPAQAIHQVGDSCYTTFATARREFLSFRIQLPQLSNRIGAGPCFANAGSKEVSITNVVGLWSGNNAGSVVVNNRHTISFKKNQYIDFVGRRFGVVTVSRITIK